MSEDPPKSNQKRKSKSLWDQDVLNYNMREKLWRITIFIEIEIFPYYFVLTKTLNLSNDDGKLA